MGKYIAESVSIESGNGKTGSTDAFKTYVIFNPLS
jgi:hypothetical protein